MTILKVLLQGKELYSLTLAKGREYFVGRSENCDIVLNKSSVSRQHMKIFFDGTAWQIELISRYTKFNYMGQDIQQLLLADGQILTVEGYEFRYIEATETKKPEAKRPEASTQEDTVPIAPTKPSYVPVEGQDLSPDATRTNEAEKSDKTAIVREDAPCLHAYVEGTDEEVLFTLDGNHWVAGRSSTCQIRLGESKASRQHFELCRTGSGFEIIDLGSSNGTYLNGKRLKAQMRTPLSLGDEIRVGKTVLVFEMRDSSYENKLSHIPAELLDEDDQSHQEESVAEDLIQSVPVTTSHSPAVIRVDSEVWQEKPNLHRQKYFRAAIALVFIGILYFAFFDSNLGKDNQEENSSKSPNALNTQPPALDKLSAEQKKLADNTYKLAKNLFIQQKYQSAKSEVNKLHAIVPFYLDSRDMEKYIDQAIQIDGDRERVRVDQEKIRKTNAQVRSIVEECRNKVKVSTTAEEIETCLAPAVEVDPENKDIQVLIQKVGMQEEKLKIGKVAKENRDTLIKKGQLLFTEAQNAENKKDYLHAIDVYTKLLISNYPDPVGNKAKARNAVANLNAKIKASVSQILSKAEQLRQQEKYREAYKALTQAIHWDPSDSRILTAMSSVENELKKKMRNLYNDGVLEENIGNLDAAKQKWRTIREQDIENGEYFKKAVTKLKRYGD